MSGNPPSSVEVTIAHNLLRCLILSIVVPLLLLAMGLCLKITADYRQNAQNQMGVSLNQVTEYVQSYFQQFDAITMTPYYHRYFTSRQTAATESQQAEQMQSEMRELFDLTTFSRSDIADIFLWSDGQLLYYSFYHELEYFSLPVEQQAWYRHAQETQGRIAVSPLSPDLGEDTVADTSSFYITRKIRNLRQPEQDNLVFLNVLSEPFARYCRELQLLYDSFLVITNEKGELIFSSRELTGGAVAQILSGDSFRYDGSSWTTLSQALDAPALKVHIVYSLDDMGRQLLLQLAGVAVIYLIGLAVVLYLYRRLNRWISQSTRPLLDTCLQLERGDLTAHCPPVDVQEFRRIGMAVNHMTDRLQEKIQKEYLMAIRQKTVQLHSLQAQIQPHFLINTLYCFITLNQIGAREQLSAGFFSLANLLRYVLSKEYFTTLGQELDFLQDYLKLQRMRFGDRLSFAVECPDTLRGLRMPRMLLQPLVENAVVHGIEPCEHPCLCRLVVECSAGVLTMTVEDNGVGFDPGQLARKEEEEARQAARLEAGAAEENSQAPRISVGLHYVRERLRMWQPDAVLEMRYTDVTRAVLRMPWKEGKQPDEDSDCGR